LKKNEEFGEQREAWHRLATRCAARIRERCGATLDKAELKLSWTA
jgi:hypothetical protein